MSKRNTDHAMYWATWQEIKKENPKMTIKEFCRVNQIAYDATRKAFQNFTKKPPKMSVKSGPKRKLPWDAWKMEFLEGPYETLAEFAKEKNMNNASGYFAKYTKNWLVDKVKFKEMQQVERERAIAEKRGQNKADELYGKVLGSLHNCLNTLEKISKKTGAMEESLENPKDMRDLVASTNDLCSGLKRLLPSILEIEGSKEAHAILRQLIAGEMDITEASLNYALLGMTLPEPVKILLSKTQAPEPDIEEGETPTDEELERRYQEGMSIVQKETTVFLPKRRQEIEKLKDECKDSDSFGEEAEEI